MPNPSGLLNGSKYVLHKSLQGGGTQLIGALVVNSSTYNREAIRLENKAAQDYREFLDGDEGVKTAEHTCDVLFSDDVAYQEVREAYSTGLIETYIIHYGNGSTQSFNFKVTNMSDSNGQDEASSTSVTFMSSDSFVQEA